MTFRVFDSVKSELDRIVVRLEAARIGTGLRLYSDFIAAGETVQSNPHFFARVEDPVPFGGEYREAPLLFASYRMIYEIRQSEIVVVSLIHSNRKPGSWHRSLNDE